MKTAVVGTTIHLPNIIDIFHRYDDDVRFFITGDMKSPTQDIVEWATDKEHVVWQDPAAQEFLGYKCSEIIGWNTTSRRNIALLEALKWGAEILIYWDSDNLPMNACYFVDFEDRFSDEFNGLQVSSINGWYNQYGSLFRHRGFPTQTQVTHPTVGHVVDANVGVVAGLCLGNPDIDAYTRMAGAPYIAIVDEPSKEGYLVAPDTRCVFNSQNTAFLRKFAPAMFLAPGIGRADDIFASLLTQRIMRDQGYQVHIGPPFTYQERNPHDPLTDLKNEMFCYEHVLEVADFLDRMTLGPDVITSCRYFWGGCSIFPQQTVEAALAFLEDVETVL